MKKIKEHKLLIVAIFTVFCLVSSIAAVAYATFSANITGTQVQYLGSSTGSGYVTMSGALTANNNSNAKVGDEITNTFTVTANVTGKMKIGYTASFSNVTTGCSPQVQVSTTGGTVLNSFENYKSLSATSFGSGTFNITNNSASHTYTIKMKCTTEGTTTNSSSSGVCSNSSYSTETACESAGYVWGTSQTANQASATGSYKVSVSASQVE